MAALAVGELRAFGANTTDATAAPPAILLPLKAALGRLVYFSHARAEYGKSAGWRIAAAYRECAIYLSLPTARQPLWPPNPKLLEMAA